MGNGSLRLADDDFWGNPTRTRAEMRAWLDEQEFAGFLLDAPSYVSLGARTTAPLAGWHVRTLAEDQSLDPESQLLVAALDLATDEVRIGLALDTGKPRGKRPPPPEDDPGEGVVSNLFTFDLRRQIDVPWRPGRWRVVVILRDRISNDVTLELGPSRTGFRDPAVDRFIEEERQKLTFPPPAPVWPEAAAPGAPRDVPSYRAREQSPAVPAAEGIALAAPRVVRLGARAACVIRGSFRLPLRKWNRVLPGAGGRRPDVGDADATGIVPITLALTGSEVVGPFVYTLRVPTCDAYDENAEAPLVTGSFNVDLLALPDAPDEPMTYFLYALGGGTIVGPTSIGLVSEDMIRPGGA